MGYQHGFVNDSKWTVVAKAGLGFAFADVEGARNNFTFVTLPIGVEAGYDFTKNVGVYAGVGYKWAFETTSNTTCNDGTSSDSVGRGTCSYHGGIAQYNDKIGTVQGVTTQVGLRVNF